MRYTIPALLAISSTTLAVELYDFEPRVNTLGPQCNAVYKQNFNGCTQNDFGNAGCSEGCLEALQALVPIVKSACASEDFGSSSNLIVAFMTGIGPQSLCRNYNALVASSGTSQTTIEATSSTAVSPSSGSSSSGSTSTVSTSTSSSNTPTASHTLSTSTPSTTSQSMQSSTSIGLLFDTSTMTTASSTTSSSHRKPTEGDGSGGGSPFDNSSTNYNSSATTDSVSVATSLLITLLVFADSMWRYR